ncbi:unnamed protein product [Brassica oleracea var. botrytis]
MASSSRRACVSVSSSPVKCVQVKGLQVSLTSMFCCSSPVHTVPPGSVRLPCLCLGLVPAIMCCGMVVAQGLTSVLILLSSSSSEVRQGSWNSPCVPMRERWRRLKKLDGGGLPTDAMSEEAWLETRRQSFARFTFTISI